MKRRLRQWAIVGSALCFICHGIGARAQTADSEDDTTYTDKIVGKSVVADPAHLVTENLVVTNKNMGKDIVLSVVRHQSYCAGEADIIERTTVWNAEGQGPVATAISAINIVNPMAWLMGQNMVTATKQSIHQQSTKAVMRFHGPIRPVSCDTKVTSDNPVADHHLIARAVGKAGISERVITDANGTAVIDQAAFNLANDAGNAAGSSAIQVFDADHPDLPLARVSFPPK
jgi:hypothetical protein